MNNNKKTTALSLHLWIPVFFFLIAIIKKKPE